MSNKPLILWIFLSFLIYSCLNNAGKKEWISVRTTDKAYPRDSVIIDTVKYFDNITTIYWINKGYLNYPYKKYASECVNLTFNAKSFNLFNLHNDSNGRYSIEKDILFYLRAKGVAHLVGKTLDPDNFKIILYLEHDSVSFLDCEELLKHLNISVPYTIKVQEDSEWTQFGTMINNKK